MTRSERPSGRDALLRRRLAAAREKVVTGDLGAGRIQTGTHALIEPAGEIVPSFAQERLWLLDDLNAGSSEYNVHQVLRVRGALDTGRLRAALTSIVERHEVLRTVFEEEDGRPRPVVSPAGPVPLPLIDVRHEPAPRISALLAELVSEPFSLPAGPLFRATLLRAGERDHYLVVVVHHIAVDGRSMSVLWEELATAYVDGPDTRLDPLPLRYADFAAWQRARLGEGRLEPRLRYWAERLRGVPPLDLPRDRPRPTVRSGRGGQVDFAIPPDLAGRLREVGATGGATLFMTLFAAFTVVLGRLTGRHDIAVGTVVAGRERPEFERIVGFFANTLVLRADLSGDPAFTELLARVRDVAVAAYTHQDVPFERIVEEVSPVRDLSRNPLFQVSFVWDHDETISFRPPGLRIEPVPVASGTAKFDLEISVAEDEAGGLTGRAGFAIDLFEQESIERLVGHFRNVLEAVVDAPGRPLSRIGMLGRLELRQLSRYGTGPPAIRDGRCLPEMFAAQVRRSPDATAVADAGCSLTYAALAERVAHLASRLRRHGVAPGSTVAVCLERSVDLVAALLAVLETGAAYVPIDPSYPAERVRLMVTDSGASAALTDEWSLPLVSGGSAAPILVGQDAGHDDAPRLRRREVAPDDLAYLIYTSGSTGRPKGVMVPHRGLANIAIDMGRRLRLCETDTVGAVTTCSFDIAALELLVPLTTGAKVVILPRDVAADGRRLARALEEWGATVVQATPATWYLLLEAGWRGPGVRALCGGEALAPPLAERLSAAVSALWNVYGPTETTIWSTVHRVDGARPGSSVPIGTPIAGTRVHVLDRAMRPVPIGVAGEVFIGGVGVARGYAGRPGLTAERFTPDPHGHGDRLYRTGDLARFRPDGALEYLGRHDDQIKVRGFRVEPAEVEAALSRHPDVVRSAVRAFGDGADAVLAGYVVVREQPGPRAGLAPRGSAAELRTFLATTLPEYMIPSVLVTLDSLPLTPNGKVDRGALPPPGTVPSARAYVAPRTAAEAMIAGIWAQVLGRERVGVHDDFFELGGHSLRATRAVSRLRTAAGSDVPLALLFRYPTVAGFAAALAERDRDRAVAGEPGDPVARPRRAIGRRPEGAAVPLAPAQRRLWFLDRLRPGRSDYNVASVARLRGPLDRAALSAAFTEVVRRHEALRTRIGRDGAHAVQIVEAPGVFAPVMSDLSGLARDVAEARAHELATADVAEPIDLSRAPLVRVRLIRLGAEEHHLVIVAHHVVVDGWSMSVLWHDLRQAYASLAGGVPPELPELPVQYGDVAWWQNAGDGSDGERLGFWRTKLAGLGPTEIIGDRTRPSTWTADGDMVSFELPLGVIDRLRRLGHRHGATLFMTLLAGFKIVLARYTGERDIAVGTPVAGRGRPELEPLIGCFVNTLVLRTEVPYGAAFTEVLAHVRDTAVAAYAHQDLPFERLVEELQPDRDLGRNPFFQIMFAMDEGDPAGSGLPGVTTEPIELATSVAKFDLSVSVTERAGHGVTGSLVYATDLYDRVTVERLAESYRGLLDAVAAAPDVPVSRLAPPAERQRAVMDWNDTGRIRSGGDSLPDLIAARAERAPDAIAVVDDRRALSYAELDRRSNRLARWLRSRGVGPETTVGVTMDRSVELVVALLGVLKSGGAYVPADPAHPRERVAFMFRDSGVRLALTGRGGAAAPAGIERFRMDQDWSKAARFAAGPLGERLDPDGLAAVYYTSGSTGTPRGVMTTHRGPVGYLHYLADTFDLSEQDVTLQLAALSFDASIRDIFGPLVTGGTTVLMPHEAIKDPFALLAAIERHGVTTLLSLVPTTLRALCLAAERAGFRDDRLRLGLVSGEPLTPAHVRDARVLGRSLRLVNQFGPTECCMTSTFHRVTAADLDAGHIPIGRPIPGSRCHVLDAGLRVLPVGAIGELYIEATGLTRGYRGSPGSTADRYVPSPFGPPGNRLFRTGDLVRWRSDGVLTFHGRRDQMVKLRGVRVELAEVEAVLAGHPGVSAAVTRVHGEGDDARLVAYLAPKGAELDIPAVRDHAAVMLSEQMRPSRYIVLDEFPLGPNGKIDRLRLPAPGPDDARDGGPASRDVAELRMTRIWEQVLGAGSVGVRDDFFALGGHSLKAIELVDAIRRELDISVPLSTVFRAPTVERLCEALPAATQADERLVVPLSGGDGHRPPLFLIHPQSGDVCCYVGLARAIGDRWPVHAVEAVGYNSGHPPLRSIEDMAARYLEDVRAVAPDGPYLLAGWSFGGNVAFEMARRLEREGARVGLLGIIDARAFGRDDLDAGYRGRSEIERYSLVAGLDTDDLGGLDEEQILSLLLRDAHEKDRLPRRARTETMRRMVSVFTANGQAADHYRPCGRVRADIHLFTATAAHPTLTSPVVSPAAWRDRTAGRLTVVPVAGNHHELMFPPQVDALSEALSKALDGFSASPPAGEVAR